MYRTTLDDFINDILAEVKEAQERNYPDFILRQDLAQILHRHELQVADDFGFENIEELREQVDDFEGDLEEARGEICEKDDEINELKERVSELEEELESAKTEISDLEERLSWNS